MKVRTGTPEEVKTFLTAPVSNLAVSVIVERAWSNDGEFLLLSKSLNTFLGLVPFLTATIILG